MRHRHAISDEDWARIKDLLPGRPGRHGKVAKDNRLFVDAVRWIAKTGAPWRDLPERFGQWNSVWRRFDRWSRKGVWRRAFDALQDPDLEWIIPDSTVVRAHRDAAGAPKNGTAAGGKRIKPWDGAGAGSRPRSTSLLTPWATRSSSS
jgi:transposase